MSWIFTPAIAVAIPDGWVPRYGITLRAPDGGEITIEGHPVAPDTSSEQFAAGHEQALKNLPGHRELFLGVSPLFSGREAVVRRVEWTNDGSTRSLLFAYCVEAGWGYLAAGHPSDGANSQVVLDILRRVSLPDLGPVERLAQGGPAVSQRPAPTAGAWAGPAAAWRKTKLTDRTEAADGSSLTFTAEELAALAALTGQRTFPGIDQRLFAGTDDGERAGVLRTAAHSLLARGFAALSPDGSITAEPTLEWVRGAVDHDLFVSIERQGDDTREATVIASTPHLGVVVKGSPTGAPGVLSVTPVAAGDVGLAIAQAMELDDHPAPLGDSVTLPASAFDEAWRAVRSGAAAGAVPLEAAALAPMLKSATSIRRARCLYRQDAGVHGGEIAWIESADGRWSISEVESGSDPLVAVEPISGTELFDLMLEVLP